MAYGPHMCIGLWLVCVSAYFMSIYVAPQYIRIIVPNMHRSDCIKCHGAVFIRSLVVRCVSSWRHLCLFHWRNDRNFFPEKIPIRYRKIEWVISRIELLIQFSANHIELIKKIETFLNCSFFLHAIFYFQNLSSHIKIHICVW